MQPADHSPSILGAELGQPFEESRSWSICLDCDGGGDHKWLAGGQPVVRHRRNVGDTGVSELPLPTVIADVDQVSAAVLGKQVSDFPVRCCMGGDMSPVRGCGR